MTQKVKRLSAETQEVEEYAQELADRLSDDRSSYDVEKIDDEWWLTKEER